MKTVIEMAGEVLDRMAPDDHCRAPYWTATDEELERFVELVRDDERETLLQNSVQAHEVEAFRDVVPCAVIRARSNT